MFPSQQELPETKWDLPKRYLHKKGQPGIIKSSADLELEALIWYPFKELVKEAASVEYEDRFHRLIRSVLRTRLLQSMCRLNALIESFVSD